MNCSKALLVLIVVSMLTPVLLPSALGDASDPLIKVIVNDVYLTAGLENSIEIVLNNTGGFSAFNVEAILSPTPVSPGIVVIDNAHTIISELRNREAMTYYSKVFVDANTPVGPYSLSLFVKYEDTVGTVETRTVNLQVGVVVNRVFNPTLSVRTDGRPLRAGSDNSVGIVLENTGVDRVEGIDVTLSSTSPLVMILDGGRFNYDTLNGSSHVIHNATIAVSRSATPGLYPLTVSVAYRDNNGKNYTKIFTLSLNVDSVELKQTEITLKRSTIIPGVVYPGSSLDLDLELACLGARANDVRAAISFDAGSPLSTTTPTIVALRSIEPDESKPASFGLLIDGEAESGSYTIRVTMSYFDSLGVPKTSVETVAIKVNGIYDFRLINEEDVAAERGSTADLIGDLLLIGTEGVRFAQVDVIGDSSFDLTSASSSYIGAIDPDSPIPLNVKVRVSSNASPGMHNVRLNLTYYDSFNKVNGTVLEFPVNVIQASATGQTQTGAIDSFWIWLRRLFGLTP